MISNKTIETEHPSIEFYYEDMDYVKKHKIILEHANNLKNIYNEILKKKYQKYTVLGQNMESILT